MPQTRALLFDVFGTLVDWRGSLLVEATGAGRRSEVAADWAAVVDDWRRAYQPALDAVRAGSPWVDLDVLQRETLRDVLARHDVALPEDEREAMVAAWRRLRPWPDSRDGLARLRTRCRTATLSNAHVPLLVDLFRAADLRVDALLSAQLADGYKPSPQVYLRGAALLGCPLERTAMVAAHPDDLVAAAGVGLLPVLVRRPDEWGTGTPPAPPDLPGLVVVDGLGELAGLLGA